MNAGSLIALGQAANDPTAIAEGTTRLDAWIAYTKANGLHEFDSPTYTGVDLYAAMHAFRNTADPATKAKWKSILDFLWTDIAANYFPGAQKLAAPYSRDYDFLAGTGGLDDWLDTPGEPTIPAVDWGGPDVYAIPTTATTLTHKIPKLTLSRWDANPFHIRRAWIGNAITLGTTSGAYDAQDKLFAVTFAGPRDLPQISVVPDPYDSPYGLLKRKDRSGHAKPAHLPVNLVSAQSDTAALLTYDFDTSKLPPDATSFTTNILLPAQSDIRLNNHPVSLAIPISTPLTLNDFLTVSRPNATAIMRVLYVSKIGEQVPTMTLMSDADGLAHGAGRMRIEHLGKGFQKSATHVRVALFVGVVETGEAKGALERFASSTVGTTINEDVWRTEVKVGETRLMVERGVKGVGVIRGIEPPAREGMGVLSVDGVELPFK